MELSNVEYYTGLEWKSITLQEAMRLEYRTSRSYRCGWCHQSVTLVIGTVVSSYFRHVNNHGIECRDLTEGIGGYSSSTYTPRQNKTFVASDYSLPLRIVLNPARNSFSFELCLIPPGYKPAEIFNIVIKANNGETLVYDSTRLSRNGSTFLPLGEIPHKRYRLELQDLKGVRTSNLSKLHAFWPEKIDAFNRNTFYFGAFDLDDAFETIFNGDSGKKLPHGDVVTVGQKLLLLTQEEPEADEDDGVSFDEPIKAKSGWKVYPFTITQNTDAARAFARKYSLNLEDTKLALRMVWPPCIEAPYTMRVSGTYLYFMRHGRRQFNISPYSPTAVRSFELGVNDSGTTYVKRDSSRGILVVEMEGNERVIGLGKENENLLFRHLVKPAELGGKSYFPKKPNLFRVLDLNGKPVSAGLHRRLPKDSALQIETFCDGFLLVRNDTGRIIERRELKANAVASRLDGIETGYSIEVYVGRDIVWNCTYDLSAPKKEADAQADDEVKMSDAEVDRMYLETLRKSGGRKRLLSRAAVSALNIPASRYPLVAAWTRRQINAGSISQQAWQLLVSVFK